MIKVFGYIIIKDEDYYDLKEKAKSNLNGRINLYKWVKKTLKGVERFCYPYALTPPTLESSMEWSENIRKNIKECEKRIKKLESGELLND